MEAEYSSFKEFIAAHKEIIYNKICEYIPSGNPKRFNEEIMRCYVDRKGKYARPSLILLWSLLYGKNIEDSILPAAAQQLSEDSILMHDDILDNNSIRRGGPAAHILYGNEYAVTAGDALFAISFKIANDAAYALGSRGNTYFSKFNDIITKTMQGQYLDVTLTKNKDIMHFTLEDYYESIHAKTAYYSVYGPMQSGAIIADASEEVINKIPLYGTPAGLAFQIADDMLDCTSTDSQLGKSVGNDIREGVKTIILWHSVQNANSNALEKLKTIYAKDPKDKTAEDIKFVIDTFNDLGSIKFAQEEAEKLTTKSLKLFEDATHDINESWIKKVARDSISYNIKRKQ